MKHSVSSTHRLFNLSDNVKKTCMLKNTTTESQLNPPKIPLNPIKSVFSLEEESQRSQKTAKKTAQKAKNNFKLKNVKSKKLLIK